MGAQQGGVAAGQIPDRVNPQAFQIAFGRLPDRKQLAGRQGPHFIRNLFGKQGVDAIRLLEIRGHLSQQLVGGDADVDGKAQLVADRILDEGGGFQGRPVQEAGARHIGKGFVDGDLLDDRGKTGEGFDEGAGAAAVQVVAGRYAHQIRAFAQGVHDRFAGDDAVLFSRDGLGQDDAAAFFPVAADDRGDRTQVGRLALL